MKFFLAFLLTFSFNAYATMGWPLCLHCMQTNTQMYAPQIAPSPYWGGQQQFGYNPWWYPYGQYQYQNWQAPGLWQNSPPSMPGHHYPGQGGVAMAKPNVYLSGPEHTKFNLRLNFEKSTLWIASPSIKGKKSSWQGEIINEGKLQVEGVTYPYLYYDYRSFLELFQSEQGFCGGKNQVIQGMIEVLHQMGFKEQEIDDFKEHWPYKLPNAAKYCVFPQEKEQLQQAVQFEISPKAHLVQINFIVYLDHEQAPAPLPKSVWRPKSASKNDPNLFEVREWGVSFIVDEKQVR